ncbi:MAG: response regulator transcription factor, partial [Thermoguttaceae bacterium]
SVADVARQMGLGCRCFSGGLAFLETVDRCATGCVVSEIRIADVGGLQLQRRLAATGSTMPFVFLSCHGSVRTAVRAIKEGAVEFLEKPCEEQAMWEAIQEAVNLSRRRQQARDRDDQVKDLLLSLNDRERRVLRMLMEGKVNREIAGEQAISVRTVELQRARLMHKFGARNVQDLIRIALVCDCRLAGRCHLEFPNTDHKKLDVLPVGS